MQDQPGMIRMNCIQLGRVFRNTPRIGIFIRRRRGIEHDELELAQFDGVRCAVRLANSTKRTRIQIVEPASPGTFARFVIAARKRPRRGSREDLWRARRNRLATLPRYPPRQCPRN